MARKPSDVVRTPKCPGCGIKAQRVILAGKQAVCINSKCRITRFTVQDFKKVDYIKNKLTRTNKSFNNSGRSKERRGRKSDEG